VLTVILPTRNEVATIGRMIDEIRALPIGARIVVLDHKSTDGTREVVQSRRRVTLIDEPEKGKGAAVRKYFKTKPPGDIVMIDADCTYPARHILNVVVALDRGTIVMGYRHWLRDGAMSRLHRFGNSMLSLLASILFAHRVHDVCSGLWGFGSGVAGNLHLVSDGFTLEADLFANAVRNGVGITQIPIGYAPRVDGSTAKLTMFDGVKIAWFLLMSRLGRR